MNTEREASRRIDGRRQLAVVASLALFAAVLASVVVAPPARADVTFDQKMLELVNQQRAAAGVAPVHASLVLNTIAGPGPYLGCGGLLGGRADDMGARNYFSHTILNCGTQSVFNILGSTVGLVYSATGENIAWMNGTTDPLVAAQRLMNDLMNSPEHKANILDPRFTEVGIGSWHTAAGQTWSGGGYPLTNVWIVSQVFAQMPLSASPAASLSPTSVSFGDRSVGTSGPTQTVTVRNSGSATLSISATSMGGANPGDFSIASDSCAATLASGASCAISVGFVPAAAGSRSATLTMTDSAPGSPHAVTLTGAGTGAALTAAPKNVVAVGGDTQLSVTWALAGSGPTPAYFAVYVFDAGGYTGKYAGACATCTSAVVPGLANGHQYFVGVYGFNGTAWGDPGVSNWAWALAVPGAPVAPQALPGNAALTVSWRAPATANSAIDGYGVFVYDAQGYTGKAAWVCAACTTVTVSGLANGTSDYAVLYAHNANGWGPLAASASVVVGTPSLPANVGVTKGIGSLTVTWTPAAANAAPIDGYGAFAYDSTGYTGKYAWVCGTCTNATIPALTNGTQYTILVYGYNSLGWGVPAYSSPIVPG